MIQPDNTGRCGGNSCVDATPKDDGVHVTSTIIGNDGLVIFTQDEWNEFIPQVKAGAWDHTVTP